jgi:hypothetical protein
VICGLAAGVEGSTSSLVGVSSVTERCGLAKTWKVAVITASSGTVKVCVAPGARMPDTLNRGCASGSGSTWLDAAAWALLGCTVDAIKSIT